MTDYAKVQALHRRLTDERRRMISTAAQTDMLPPAGCLTRMSDLDGAIVAVEAVLEERTSLQASAMTVNAVPGARHAGLAN